MVLGYALSTGLKLSHPLIPYVTEEIWNSLPQDTDGLLIDQQFPKSQELERFHNSQLNVTVLKTVKLVKEIRSLKTRTGMKQKFSPTVFLDLPPSELPDITPMKLYIESLAICKVTFDSLPQFERSDFITVIIQLDGKICKISTPKVRSHVKKFSFELLSSLIINYSLQGEATDKYLEGEKNKILKLQVKLAKLKHQYENPNFQQNASPEVKEKLKKRVTFIFQ